MVHQLDHLPDDPVLHIHPETNPTPKVLGLTKQRNPKPTFFTVIRVGVQ
jgi:hypothetical protein